MWRMWRIMTLVVFCCAGRGQDGLDPSGPRTLGKPDRGASSPGRTEDRDGRVAPISGSLQPTSESLEEELDNQENIISQLLGDYDKVKTESSGSDCVCRCVVRPIKRSDCSRLHDTDPASLSQDFYTVETITKGTDCKKCVCMAPPSAVNPCEGEYRFKKLQEASKDDIKLATIIDLLEGSLYGMDLLKLNSVTTKLLSRVDNLEKVFSRNFTERTREKERVKEKNKDKDKKVQPKKKKTNDLERSGTAAFGQKQKNPEGQIKKVQHEDGQVQQQPSKNGTETKSTVKDKNNMLIRGVTFYKADEDSFKEKEENNQNTGRGKNTVLTQKDLKLPTVTRSPSLPLKPINEPKSKVLSNSSLTHQPKIPSTSSTQAAPTKSTPLIIKVTDKINPTTPGRTNQSKLPTMRGDFLYTTPATPHTTDTNIHPPSNSNPTTSLQPRSRSRLSWTESPADQPKTTKKPAGVCKDTVASISEPAQQNSYGLRDGAWMKDARGHGKVIYLTNGLFGNNLLEFRDMDTFKSGQPSNSYKLPYDFTGTGHVVFNGAFFYNRAFSRDVIRFDLRRRYVSAWTTLHDAILEEQTHRTETEVEFAVDESGLWLLYPALDTEGFHQEVILLIHLHHRDLQPIQTFRTGLRRGRYGDTFLVCGVLYGVDSMERRYANVTYAYDTHTFTHTVPSLAFTNMHSHTSQVSYNPLDKKLYAWDGGHQMNYDVIFAYL